MLPGTLLPRVIALSCVLVLLVRKWRGNDGARGVGIDGDTTRRIEEKMRAVKFIKVNDHVYELANPTRNKKSVELVFFHGLQQEECDERAHERTWKDKNDADWWPEWLLETEYFPDARILSISYDAWAKITHNRGRQDPYSLGESLVHSLMLARVGQDGCPVVLVGHGLGCLILKYVCYQAHSTLALNQSKWDLEEFLHNIRGMFFFAPPNQGSRDADELAARTNGPVVRELMTLSTSRARLNAEFQATRNRYKWKVYVVGESHGMGKSKGQVVEEASARHDVDYFISVGENHTDVCRPVDRSSTSFQSLVNYIGMILKEATNVEAGEDFQELPSTVGLTKTANRLAESLRDKSCTSHVQFLGLTGMGGVGKTTLAQAIFQIIFGDFHSTCFLENVKDPVETNSRYLTLQSKILDKIQRRGRSVSIKVNWTDLRGKKVLFVLDDVASREQILGLDECRDFGQGSCVIVTSRNRSIFDQCDFKEVKFHVEEVKFLNSEDSLRLFCRHAFHEDRIPSQFDKYERLSMRITRKCGGLPLSLQVIGNHLHHCQPRDERERMTMWEEALTKLQKADCLEWDDTDRLWAVLRVSYDGLGEIEKYMFLDTANCFSGEDERDVLAMWRGLYQGSVSGWKKLRDRNLANATLRNEGEFESPVISMHEQLRDFGRRESLQYGRWLCDTEKALDLLNCISSNQQEKEKIEIMKLDSWPEEQTFNMSRLVEFSKMKVLWLKDVFLKNVCGRIVKPLVSVKLSGSRDHFGEPNIQQPDLEHTLLSFGEIPSLVHFNLKLEVDSSEHKTFLQEFLDDRRHEIHRDSTAQNPSSTLGSPSKLQHLVIDGVTPWERFGQLKSVKYLALNNCLSQRLGSFNSSFQDMATLEVLKIHRWNRLKCLPESLGFLANLEHLEVSNCLNLERLPSFLHLSNLETLKLWNLPRLSSLPEDMGRLKRLRRLEIVNCTKVAFLPSSSTNLAWLESLILESCTMLRFLPSQYDCMSRLLEFQLKGLPNIEELPISLGAAACIKRLTIVNCKKIRISPYSFLHLNKLEDLKLKGLSLMETVPVSSEGFPELRTLTLRNCKMLEELPSTIKTAKLHAIKLTALPRLRSVPSSFEDKRFSCEVFIINLHLNEPQQDLEESQTHGYRLGKYQSLGFLAKIVHLEVSNCLNLERFPSFLHLSNLKTLKLWNLPRLSSLPEDMGRLKRLRRLEIGNCTKVAFLPSFTNFAWFCVHKFGGVANRHPHHRERTTNV